MPYVLALDQGTTSSRALVFDERATVRGAAQGEFPQYFPEPGFVEHDAEEIWASQLAVAREAMRGAGVAASDLAAIGITNQRETTILWERETGRPIHRAIVWQDRRTTAVCERLAANGAEALVRRKTGLLLDAYFSATKIAWILDHVSGARERAVRGELAFGTVDTWLIWNLTDGATHRTDVTNASRTLLFDLERLDWDDELLALFCVPRAVLPELRPSVAEFGRAAARHLGGAVRIAGVAGDQHAALVGHAGFARGIAKNTYGTGSFFLLNTGDELVRGTHGVLTTIGYALEADRATYALEGSIFVTGAAVQWLRDGLGVIAQASDVEALAASVPDSGGVTFVPALAGLGAPHWDPHARGTILGLTRGSTKAHLARAALEAMALQSTEVARAMERDAGLTLAELRVDGGASASDLTMQFQADLLGADVVRARSPETTALGAAFLAGIGAGLWAGPEAVAALREEGRRFRPAMATAEREGRLRLWARAIERASGWAREEKPP